MNDQLLEISKAIGINTAAITGAAWGYFKIFLHRVDTMIERKKKNIEILDSIIANQPDALNDQKETILKLSALEKFNAFYDVKFDFQTMIACLNTETPQQTIQVVKSYKNNIHIESNQIKPNRIFDETNHVWKYFFYAYMALSFTLAIFGLVFPNMLYHGKELTIHESLIIRLMYVGLLIFTLREIWKLKKAQKYIKSIS